MKYAWIENNKIRDLAINPSEQFHPDVAQYYDTEVPDEVQNGWDWNGTVATAPVIPDPVVEPNPVVKITSPISTPKLTDVVITSEIIDGNDGISIITGINETYYVPIKNAMTGELDQMVQMAIINGSGSATIQFANPGIYDIAEEFIRPIPTIPFEKTTDIVVI